MLDSSRWPQRLIFTLIAITIIQLAVSIPHHRVQGDEAWLGEQCYFVAHDGVMRSELFTGYAQQDERILVTHKLFILLGGVSVWLFGWDILSLRLLSLLSGVLACGLVYVELRRSEPLAIARWIGVFSLLAAPLVFKFINIYRPEVMLGATGLASYMFLARYLRQHDRTSLVLSAVIAGLAFLVHVNGMIYAAAALVVLALHRRYSAIALYAPIAIAVGALYFLDVIGHWDLLFYQLHQVPSLTADDFRWDAPLWRLLDEHKRLFRKPGIILTSLLFFGSFVYMWKWQPERRRSLLAYVAILILGLAVVAQAKTTPYAIALLPIFALVIAGATTHWLQMRHQMSRWITILGCVLWVGFIVHSLFDNTRTALSPKQDIVEHNREIAAVLPPGATVLVPMTFIFNEIDHFHVRAVMAAELELEGHHDATLSISRILTYGRTRGVTAYVFDHAQCERFGLSRSGMGDRYGEFVVALITEEGTMVLVHSSGAAYGRILHPKVQDGTSSSIQNVAT